MNNAIIFAGGEITGFDLKEFNILDKKIICVDKGLEFAINNNITIHVLIGDFDSVNKIYLEEIKKNKLEIKTYNSDKDMSDLQLAFEYCVNNNIDKIDLFGATGGRIDHSLSNIYLLKKYAQKGLDIRIINSNNIVRYINKDTQIKKSDWYFSILPTNEECIFSLTGAKWNLTNYKLEYGSTHTVSNRFENDLNIKIIKGDMYLILSRD